MRTRRLGQRSATRRKGLRSDCAALTHPTHAPFSASYRLTDEEGATPVFHLGPVGGEPGRMKRTLLTAAPRAQVSTKRQRAKILSTGRQTTRRTGGTGGIHGWPFHAIPADLTDSLPPVPPVLFVVLSWNESLFHSTSDCSIPPLVDHQRWFVERVSFRCKFDQRTARGNRAPVQGD